MRSPGKTLSGASPEPRMRLLLHRQLILFARFGTQTPWKNAPAPERTDRSPCRPCGRTALRATHSLRQPHSAILNPPAPTPVAPPSEPPASPTPSAASAPRNPHRRPPRPHPTRAPQPAPHPTPADLKFPASSIANSATLQPSGFPWIHWDNVERSNVSIRQHSIAFSARIACAGAWWPNSLLRFPD